MVLAGLLRQTAYMDRCALEMGVGEAMKRWLFGARRISQQGLQDLNMWQFQMSWLLSVSVKIPNLFKVKKCTNHWLSSAISDRPSRSLNKSMLTFLLPSCLDHLKLRLRKKLLWVVSMASRRSPFAVRRRAGRTLLRLYSLSLRLWPWGGAVGWSLSFQTCQSALEMSCESLQCFLYVITFNPVIVFYSRLFILVFLLYVHAAWSKRQFSLWRTVKFCSLQSSSYFLSLCPPPRSPPSPQFSLFLYILTQSVSTPAPTSQLWCCWSH